MSLRSIEFDWTKEPTTATAGKTPPTDPMTRGERRAVLIAVAVVAGLIVIGAAVWAVLDGRSDSANSVGKCVTVAVASSMGGAVEHACGRAAHDWCVAADARHDVHAQAVQVGCRKAGILP
ncbi:MAG: hypothetical protein NVSMB60_22290 [Mycobacterium sp.]